MLRLFAGRCARSVGTYGSSSLATNTTSSDLLSTSTRALATATRGRPRGRSIKRQNLASRGRSTAQSRTKKGKAKRVAAKGKRTKKSSTKGKKVGKKKASKKSTKPKTVSATKGVKKIVYGPEKPKRPQSPFLLFIRDFRNRNSQLTVPEQAKAAGKEWKTLSEDVKKPYEDQAKRLRDAYLERKQEYDQKKKPKRALNAYLIFAKDKRNEFSNLPVIEQGKKIGELWKGLGESEKQVYLQKQKNASSQYYEALGAWNKVWQVPAS